jgi:hypothetical protein
MANTEIALAVHAYGRDEVTRHRDMREARLRIGKICSANGWRPVVRVESPLGEYGALYADMPATVAQAGVQGTYKIVPDHQVSFCSPCGRAHVK